MQASESPAFFCVGLLFLFVCFFARCVIFLSRVSRAAAASDHLLKRWRSGAVRMTLFSSPPFFSPLFSLSIRTNLPFTSSSAQLVTPGQPGLVKEISWQQKRQVPRTGGVSPSVKAVVSLFQMAPGFPWSQFQSCPVLPDSIQSIRWPTFQGWKLTPSRPMDVLLCKPKVC